MSTGLARSMALSALTWALAAASLLQPQPQLRGASNASASLQSASATPTHFVLRDGQAAYCLSSDGDRIGDGVELRLRECDQTWRRGGQNFYLDGAGQIRAHRDPSYCLAIDGEARAGGAPLRLRRCDAADGGQIWHFWLWGRIRCFRSRASECVAVRGGRAFDGAELRAQPCTAGAPGGGSQDWLQVVPAKGGRVAYALPDEDRACSGPWAPVSEGEEACAAAAEALQPGSGCQWPSSPLLPWSRAVQTVDEPSRPPGCAFYGACQGGCSLDFNPTGTGSSCPTQGDCMSTSVICQMPLASSREDWI